jgi:hypothetical protein
VDYVQHHEAYQSSFENQSDLYNFQAGRIVFLSRFDFEEGCAVDVPALIYIADEFS